MDHLKGMPDSARRRWAQMDEELFGLLDALEAHSDDSLNGLPGPDKWSAMQVLHHVMRSEQLALAYLRKKLSGDSKALPPATFQNRLRSLALTLWLRTPLKVKAPTAVSGEHLPERDELASIRATWEELRAEFQQFLEDQHSVVFKKAVFRHPFAGRLTLGGMLVFMHEHFRRHRKQALRAVKAVKG